MEFDLKELATIEKALRLYSEHNARRGHSALSHLGAEPFVIEDRKACELIRRIEEDEG